MTLDAIFDIELEKVEEDRRVLISLLKPGTICFYCGESAVEDNILHYYGGETHWHRPCHQEAGQRYRTRVNKKVKKKRYNIERRGEGYLLKVAPISVEIPISKQHRWIKEL